MANDEDVARLQQGVAAWSDWRAHEDLMAVTRRAEEVRGAEENFKEYLHQLGPAH